MQITQSVRETGVVDCFLRLRPWLVEGRADEVKFSITSVKMIHCDEFFVFS